TNLSYTLGLADIGALVRIVVTVNNLDGSASAASNPTVTVVGQAPVNTFRPTIAGTPTRAQTLTSTPGTWQGAGNLYSYHCQRSPDGTTWTDIAGATADSYTLTVADVANKVRLVVTATNAEASASQPTNPTTTVSASPPFNAVLPVITGSTQRSFTLT